MTAPSNVVTLVVGGKRFEGWLRVRVTAGIERVARDFDIEITLDWATGALGQTICKKYDACELYIGTDKVLTGYVDSCPIGYDARGRRLGISGRSKTQDLIDCSAADAPGQWMGQKIERIAAALAAPYGISVITEVDTGAAIADHQVQQGETAFESIDRMLRLRQLLATDDAYGNLVFTKPGIKRATTALVHPGNIFSADYQNDGRDRFSLITVKGQGSGSDSAYGDAVAHACGTAKDAGVPRYRNLVMFQYGQATSSSCSDRAAFEVDYRAGRSQAVTYTVQGWRQGDGKLWDPGMLVYVSDPNLDIARDMLIAEVTNELDDRSMTTSLLVAPPEAFKRIEE